MPNNNSGKSIAIIGSGISGLSCAYHLHSNYRVTVFEKENRLGGHTDTHSFTIDGKKINIDSGFIIFCREHYPNFCRMLDELKVTSQITDMSFSVHNRKSGLIYNATSLNSLFCQRKNIFSFRFYRMLLDLLRFYIQAKKVLKSTDTNYTVEEYLNNNHYSIHFAEDHLYPMISALWSTTPEKVKAYPILHLIEFLSKHGLMNILTRPEWRVIRNGSNSYIEAIKKQVKCTWRIGTPILSIERDNNKILIKTVKGEEIFDAVIFATHADQTLKILGDDASKDERTILSAIKFEKNHVVVHTDENIMHSNKLSWASWNAEVPNAFNPNTLKCCTANYWMNSLQGINTKTNIFTSLNSHNIIDKDKILAERHYSHPIFTKESVNAQAQKHLLDGFKNSYFVGAYWGWGFHEDGARSAAEVCDKITSTLKSTQ